MLVFKLRVEIYKLLQTEQTSWLTFGPEQFAASVFTWSVRLSCFIIYLFSPAGCYAEHIKVPWFLQLIQELLGYNWAGSWAMAVSPHGPGDMRHRERELLKIENAAEVTEQI